MATFETIDRYVHTRGGTHLVRQRKLTGAWEIVAVTIRGILIGTGAILTIVVSAFVPEQDELWVGMLGGGLCSLAGLSAVPWRVVATKALGRRYDWIAGKPALYSIVSIRVNS